MKPRSVQSARDVDMGSPSAPPPLVDRQHCDDLVGTYEPPVAERHHTDVRGPHNVFCAHMHIIANTCSIEIAMEAGRVVRTPDVRTTRTASLRIISLLPVESIQHARQDRRGAAVELGQPHPVRANPGMYRLLWSPAVSRESRAAAEGHGVLRIVLERGASLGQLRVSVEPPIRVMMAAVTGAALSMVSQPELFGDGAFAETLREAVIAAVVVSGSNSPASKRHKRTNSS